MFSLVPDPETGSWDTGPEPEVDLDPDLDPVLDLEPYLESDPDPEGGSPDTGPELEPDLDQYQINIEYQT